MPYKDPKDVLVDAVKFPQAIEGMLPEGAPKISQTLQDIAGKMPDLPDFPVEIPDLPAPPELPTLPVGAKTAQPYTGGWTTPNAGGRPLTNEIVS